MPRQPSRPCLPGTLALALALAWAATAPASAVAASQRTPSSLRQAQAVAAAPAIDPDLGARLASVVNRARRQAGRSTLIVDTDRIASVAATRTLDMARTRRVAPQATSTGLTVDDLMTAQGVRWLTGGEIATWAGGPIDADPLSALVLQLLSSPSNRALLLAPAVSHIGVAVAILDGGVEVRVPVRAGTTTATAPRVAIASLVLLERDGPAAPKLSASRPDTGAARGVAIDVTPDGPGRLSVVITDDAGELLAIVAWDKVVRARTVLRWNGRAGGRVAPAGTYQVRAFTVDANGRASDPSRVGIVLGR
jgi:uncharacterized protein YkwD